MAARVIHDEGVRVAEQNLWMHRDAGGARGLGGDLAEPLARVVQARRLERRRVGRQGPRDRAVGSGSDMHEVDATALAAREGQRPREGARRLGRKIRGADDQIG